MKRTLAFTFIFGAVTGSALTTYFAVESAPQILPGEVKVLTKTEFRNTPFETINGDVLEITDESSHSGDSHHDDHPETVGYEIPDEGMEAIQTQMDKFERSISSEPEPQATEELPTSVPEEAPPEAPPEPQTENSNEDEPK